MNRPSAHSGARCPRIVLFANNLVGLLVARYLRARDEKIVALVVHPHEEARHRQDIVEAAGVPDTLVLEGPELFTPNGLERLASTSPSIGVSAFFRYIFRPEMIALFPDGILNVHSALLPYNRGAHPNVWPIVEGTPAGATVHYVDEGVDTGDVVSQWEIETLPTDTGMSLYRRLEQACVDLFADTWPAVLEGRATRTCQDVRAGTYHRKADVSRIDAIDLDAPSTARQLINRIRARSFPPYEGAYFIENGRRIYLHLELYEAEPSERS